MQSATNKQLCFGKDGYFSLEEGNKKAPSSRKKKKKLIITDADINQIHLAI